MAGEAAQVDPRAVLSEALYNDPEVGPEFKALIAKKFPQAQIPEVIAGRAATAQIKPLTDKITELEKRLATKDQESAREAARAEVINDPELRIAREELPAVEKLMTEELIGTHRAAAEVFRARQRSTAQPGTVYDFGMQVPGHMGAGGDEYKGIVENRQGWTKNRINTILNDFARGGGDKWMR